MSTYDTFTAGTPAGGASSSSTPRTRSASEGDLGSASGPHRDGAGRYARVERVEDPPNKTDPLVGHSRGLLAASPLTTPAKRGEVEKYTMEPAGVVPKDAPTVTGATQEKPYMGLINLDDLSRDARDDATASPGGFSTPRASTAQGANALDFSDKAGGGATVVATPAKPSVALAETNVWNRSFVAGWMNEVRATREQFRNTSMPSVENGKFFLEIPMQLYLEQRTGSKDPRVWYGLLLETAFPRMDVTVLMVGKAARELVGKAKVGHQSESPVELLNKLQVVHHGLKVHAHVGEALRQQQEDTGKGPLLEAAFQALFDELPPKLKSMWEFEMKERVSTRKEKTPGALSVWYGAKLDKGLFQGLGMEYLTSKQRGDRAVVGASSVRGACHNCGVVGHYAAQCSRPAPKRVAGVQLAPPQPYLKAASFKQKERPPPRQLNQVLQSFCSQVFLFCLKKHF
jgi:hypothetical protein